MLSLLLGWPAHGDTHVKKVYRQANVGMGADALPSFHHLRRPMDVVEEKKGVFVGGIQALLKIVQCRGLEVVAIDEHKVGRAVER